MGYVHGTNFVFIMIHVGMNVTRVDRAKTNGNNIQSSAIEFYL